MSESQPEVYSQHQLWKERWKGYWLRQLSTCLHLPVAALDIPTISSVVRFTETSVFNFSGSITPTVMATNPLFSLPSKGAPMNTMLTTM